MNRDQSDSFEPGLDSDLDAGGPGDRADGSAAGRSAFGPASSAPSLDPAETLRLIQAQQAKVREREPDGRVFYGAWGIAWFAGYLILEFTRDSAGRPPVWAFIVFGSLLVAAMTATVVHATVRTRGVRGVSARTGAMYGWSWALAFMAYGMIIGGIGRAGASYDTMTLLTNGVSCLIVGIQYLAAGALFREMRSYVLGVWIILVAALATMAGVDAVFWVMAYLGGGGLLVMTLIEQILRVRGRRTRWGAATTAASAGGGSVGGDHVDSARPGDRTGADRMVGRREGVLGEYPEPTVPPAPPEPPESGQPPGPVNGDPR